MKILYKEKQFAVFLTEPCTSAVSQLHELCGYDKLLFHEPHLSVVASCLPPTTLHTSVMLAVSHRSHVSLFVVLTKGCDALCSTPCSVAPVWYRTS